MSPDVEVLFDKMRATARHIEDRQSPDAAETVSVKPMRAARALPNNH